MEETKSCGRCKQQKTLENFCKCKDQKSGLHNRCRECQKVDRRKWYLINREYELEKSNSPEERARKNAWKQDKYWNDPEFRTKYLEKNRERNQKEENKIKARIRRRKWMKIPHNRISISLRNRMRQALKGKSNKIESSEKLLGISFIEFKSYIETLFEEGMSWDNYGEWVMDHIIPCAFFDLEKEEHQKICFHYLNIQPMWENENLRKGAKITVDNLEELIIKIKEKIR